MSGPLDMFSQTHFPLLKRIALSYDLIGKKISTVSFLWHSQNLHRNSRTVVKIDISFHKQCFKESAGEIGSFVSFKQGRPYLNVRSLCII
jgi:hypothetical protein